MKRKRADIEKIVRMFAKMQRKFKDEQDAFAVCKEEFNKEMELAFESGLIDKSFECNISDTYDSDIVSVKVSRVQKVDVEFDADAVERALGDRAKIVISKKYEICDFASLVEYLKKCGANPKIFKKFIKVEKSVDTKELDRLEEIGFVDAEELDGCYTVKKSKPYFTLRVERGKDGEKR